MKPFKNRAAMTEVNSSNVLTIGGILIQEWLVKDKDSHPYSLKKSCLLSPYLKGVNNVITHFLVLGY